MSVVFNQPEQAIKEGGSAFPHQFKTENYTERFMGMTLRDYFAGEALPEAIQDYDRINSKPGQKDRVLPYANALMTREQIIANQAFKYADAMLAARSGEQS